VRTHSASEEGTGPIAQPARGKLTPHDQPSQVAVRRVDPGGWGLEAGPGGGRRPGSVKKFLVPGLDLGSPSGRQ
jgi:hypothetical protein